MTTREGELQAAHASEHRAALKAMPPHCGRHVLARPRLLAQLREAARQPLLALVARAGYGKTSLLAQLRKELLATGAAVAWLSAEPTDTAAAFVTALVASMRAALGARLSMPSLDRISGTDVDLQLAGELLVQVHEIAAPVWVLIDDLHNLADEHASEFVHYLVRNAPPNFHLAVSSRTELPFSVVDLQAHGRLADFRTDDLRFDLSDTVAFLRGRFGDGVDIDTCARLHERTEGWPMALQLVAASMDRKGGAESAVSRLSGASGDIARYFAQFVLERLTPETETMLVRSSILKMLRPQLCAALADLADCREALAALEHDTGLVSSVEGDGDVYRLHPLFGEYLRSRAEALARSELQALHGVAARWYAQHDMFEEAAEHAFQAGMQQQAMDWIESCLRQLGSQGRVTEVLAWLDRLPAEELERREGIQLTAAWACALCHRPLDAERLAQIILRRPGVTPATALQANIVRSAVAIHCDDYERARSCLESCEEPLGPLHGNSLSFIAIHSGAPEKARYYQRLADRRRPGRGHYDAMYGAFAVGLSYLVQGQVGAARRVFAEAMEAAESGAGWRTPAAALQAAGLAAACWELGAEGEARSLLADRLDLIEQTALPDGVLLACLVLARYESQAGREGKALDVLNSLAGIGRARAQPRLVAVSLAEQLRQHAARNRLESCKPLMGGLDALVAEGAGAAHGLEAQLLLIRETAAARVALLDFDHERARVALDGAARIAQGLGRGRDAITIGILRACCSHDPQGEGLRRLAEAMSLAESFGLVRAVADDWPAAADCLSTLVEPGHPAASRISPAFIERALALCNPGAPGEADRGAQAASRQRPAQTTARELEILAALAQGRSNKDIARMLDVEPATVKWHLKNLFAKLNAASRRHAVDRARLLGIID
ncbi:MAG: hypothetical protein J0H00_01630 [Burkholderiales bacterium]|nr:hypothetical protein [Burkholderiales bacterium]OJX07517.1 MAG: LuxR family transcriptional regulator [Burkholderiales bacterium 70-64]